MVAVLGVDPSLVMTGLACSDGLRLYVRRVGTHPSPPTVGGKLYRIIPAQHPRYPWLYCVDAKRSGYHE